MRSSTLLLRLTMGLLFLVGLAGQAGAGEAAFVGKLALIDDPEVAKELALTDDVKKKLQDLIKNREQEAVGIAAKLKGQPQAKQAEALAPFVAESEKLGMALLDDNQIAKLNKLKVAKGGMTGVLAPEMVAKLQITDDQKKEIGPLVDEFRRIMTSGSEFQKRVAPQSYEKKIAGLLTDAQRGTWEQLSGVPAGGSAVAQAGGPAAPPGPGGSAPPGPGGVNVQRAGGVAELTVSEDGKLKFDFVFTPWRNVLEYFAKKGGYAFATDKWPQGTFNYSDPKYYTPEEALDILNLHLITKGFILAKREKLLRLFDTVNDGPVPPEFVEEVSANEIENHGKFELLTVYFQLDKWPPAEAKAEIKERLGPYGSITVLTASRQLVVTELGGRLRWIKRTIDEVENPIKVKSDQRLFMIKLNRLTPSEFVTNVKQLLGIPAADFATPDGNLRLAISEIDGVVFCYGTPPRIEQVQEFARQMDPPTQGRPGSGLVSIATEQPQFASYEIRRADPVHAENTIRTLLAGRAPDLRIQLDPKSQKLSVWGKPAEHRAVQEILRELEQNANLAEVIRLRKIGPQEAVTSLNQFVGGDPSGKTATNGFMAIADLNNSSITISGTPRQIEQAKDWLYQMGEPLTGFGGGGGRVAGVPDDRANKRVLPLSSRTVKYIMENYPEVWSNERARVVEGKVSNLMSSSAAPAGADAPPPSGKAAPPTEKAAPPAGKTAPKGKSAPPTPKTEGKPIPQPNQPAIKSDITLRREAEERKEAEQEAAERRRAAKHVWFVSDPPVGAESATADQAPATVAQQPGAEVIQQPSAASNPPAGTATNGSPPGAPEIYMHISPKGIVIESLDLDALDEFQNILEALVQADKRLGRRPERFQVRHKDADVAANMLKALIEGGATVSDGGLGNMASNMFGGGLGGMAGLLLGSGGGNSNPTGAVNITGGGFDGTIVPDLETNELLVMATPESLDLVEKLLKDVDVAESPLPQESPPARFIPVMHGKADAMMTLVKEQFAGQIYGESTGNRGGQQPQPQDIAMLLLTGGRGGPGGGRGGGGGRGNQQSNMGEKKKIKISVAQETNSLIVTAPKSLFDDVEDFVHMVDLENVVPNQTVSVVNLKKVSSDAAYVSLGSMLGTNATITRVLPFNPNALAGRGGQANQMNNQQLPRQGGPLQGGQQQPGQFNPALAAQMQALNQGRGGGRGGQPGGFGGQGGFGGPGGGFGGQGGFGGAPGGGRGGQGGFGGGQPGGGGRGGGQGGFGGGQPGGGGGRGGGGGGGIPGGGGGGRGGGPGGGGFQ